MDVQKIRNTYERIKGKKESLETRLADKKKELKLLKQDETLAEEALEVLQKVALQTQGALKYNIETPVTNALAATLDVPYELQLDFDIKRGKTECSLKFRRDGHEISPKDSSGGTALDIASLALRVALWSMSVNKTAPIFILDEFDKHISSDLLYKTGALIKQLSDDLGIQFIIVTHDQENLARNADAVFKVSMKDLVSSAKEIQIT